MPEKKESFNADLNRWFRVQASRIGSVGSPLLGVVFEDVTERKLAEQVLRDSEERQAFLLKLSDALRPLADPVAEQTAAMKLLVEHLGLVRAAYYEVDDDQNGMTLAASVETDPITWPKRLRMSDFAPDITETYRAGKVYRVADSNTDPRLSEEGRAAILDLGIQSFVGAQLVKNGKLLVVLCVHAREPRDWRDHELQLLEEVAGRTWSSAERARPEVTVRESEAKYRSLFGNMADGFAICSMVRDDGGRAVDLTCLELNQAVERQTSVDRQMFIGDDYPRWLRKATWSGGCPSMPVWPIPANR